MPINIYPNTLKRRSRYDYFIIWGNGIQHSDAIIEILRTEPDIKILRTKRYFVNNMRKFVFDLYRSDSVPVSHLKSKLRYLFNAVPQIIVIFVKNLSPAAVPVGKGRFRKPQCKNVARIKNDLRERFNPKINGKRTEWHVVHASDYEEQVDYLLVMLGHSDGIYYLDTSSPHLPFKRPFHIETPTEYKLLSIALDNMDASILDEVDSKAIKLTPTRVIETPHYHALQGKEYEYIRYIKRFQYAQLVEDHSIDNLRKLSKLPNDQLEAMDPILIRRDYDRFRILDGVHRASVLLFRGYKSTICVQLNK